MNSPRYEFSLSVVVAIYNDVQVIDELYSRLKDVLQSITNKYQLIFVNDGSTDNSLDLLKNLNSDDPNIDIINLSRNFSQPNAIAAGLDYAVNDVIVVMDSDLQDKPEDIPTLIDAMIESNTSMAIARWISREDNLFKRICSSVFYRASQKFTDLDYGPDLGVFRVFRSSVLTELKKFPESTGTALSLMYWMGIDHVSVDLQRDPRHAGLSGYTVGKMMRLAVQRIISYSLLPVHLILYSGIIFSLISVLYSAVYLILTYGYDLFIPFSTILFALFLFFTGINFIAIGIIGEYLGKTFTEVRHRPKYVIDHLNSSVSSRSGETNREGGVE